MGILVTGEAGFMVGSEPPHGADPGNGFSPCPVGLAN